jgi:hypothetical protein
LDHRFLVAGLAASLACGPPAVPALAPPVSSSYLFVWAGDADKKESDFLAVVDADPRSARYGAVLATLPVGAVATSPHHTEHAMPMGGVLWANGFDSSRTFRFDLRDALHPKLMVPLGDPPPFSHPHSYARLANGNVLVTFQHRTENGRVATGGLVEFDTAGRVVRSAPAGAEAIDAGIRPYSLLVLPKIDRVVTTATDMHLQSRSRAVQVWRLSDLTLLHTILLPPGPRGDASAMTAEPRLLADGQTVLVNTFTCGLYRLHGLSGAMPTAEWVYSTPWQQPPFCALPVVVGRWWIQTVGPEHAVATLDVSEPSQPKETSRLTLGPDEVPHWIALEPNSRRLVITGYRALQSRVLVAWVNPGTGVVTVDTTFQADFARDQWPHGSTGPAIPHGAVFSRP